MERFRRVYWTNIHDLPMGSEYKKKIVDCGVYLKSEMKRIDKSKKIRMADVFSLRSTFNNLVVEIINLAQQGTRDNADKQVIVELKTDISNIHTQLDKYEHDNMRHGVTEANIAMYFSKIESNATAVYDALIEAGREAQGVTEKKLLEVHIEKRFLYALWGAIVRRSSLLTPAAKPKKDSFYGGVKILSSEEDKSGLEKKWKTLNKGGRR